jgi:hypothetical protein
MRWILLVTLMFASCAVAQEKADVIYQTTDSVTTMAVGGTAGVVAHAPYSATITNESVQTLADGTRIVQKDLGTTARDSEGRTRQDTVLPSIGNLSAENAPHLIFIHDPVTQVSYTLNLTEKTAQKIPALPHFEVHTDGGMTGGAIAMRFDTANGEGAPPPPPPDAMPPTAMAVPATRVLFQRKLDTSDRDSDTRTEDLGTQTMEGVLVNGVRTTHTIPVGEIGNDRPLAIVTEVWTSPELNTIVYSKRSDPRMGEQTFRLTNISRAEPSASLFTVPSDYKILDGPKPFLYRRTQ